MTIEQFDRPATWPEATWYDESATLEPGHLELFAEPGDDDDDDDDDLEGDPDEDDYRD